MKPSSSLLSDLGEHLTNLLELICHAGEPLPDRRLEPVPVESKDSDPSGESTNSHS